MKIDSCKLFGVEEGEKFKFDGYVDIYFIKNGYLYFIDDYGEQKSYLNINEVVGKNIIKLPKKKQFSQDTLNFFKCIDKRWRYIAKDKNGTISAFGSKPTKKERCWLNYDGFDCLDVFKDSLFDEIKWEDEEPIRIDDYVER